MALTYNYLDLPQTASKTSTSLTYLYDATGRKLRKTAVVSASERAAQKAGYPNAKGEVVEALGKTTTGKAKEAEAARVRTDRANGHDLPLNKEKDKRYRN